MATFDNSNTAKADERQEATNSFKNRFAAFLHKVWWSMSVMKENFESEGDGSRSRERSAERLRDEEAWSRMAGEGCPNVQPPYPLRQAIHQPDNAASSG